MSQTLPTTNAIAASTSTGTLISNMAVVARTDAQAVPQLVKALSTLDPALAEQINGKALLASKSPWGTLLGGIIGLLVAKYGLGWSPEVVTLVAGVGVLLGGYVMRAVTKAPITGAVSKGA